MYAVHQKSTHPVYINICGLKVGGQTKGHLEKVEGFPEWWMGRASLGESSITTVSDVLPLLRRIHHGRASVA